MSHKPLAWAAILAWVVASILLVLDQTAAARPGSLLDFLLAIAATLTGLAALYRLQETAIAPVREAFMHGYQLCLQQFTAAQRADKAESDLAEVLHPPAGAWTATTPRAAEPVAVGGEDRARSHRARRPRPWDRLN